MLSSSLNDKNFNISNLILVFFTSFFILSRLIKKEISTEFSIESISSDVTSILFSSKKSDTNEHSSFDLNKITI